MLRIAFPTKIADPKATYEIAFGSIERPVDGREVPALKWADLSGDRVSGKGKCGITMVNADKYGHRATDNVLRPNAPSLQPRARPASRNGQPHIRLAILPHDGPVSVSEATRAGASFGCR